MKEKTFDEYGKVPPYNIDMEESVLSILISYCDEPSYIETAFKFLKPEMFYKEHHQTVFKSIMELFSNDKPYDSISLVCHLGDSNKLVEIGGPYFITLISMKKNSVYSFEHYCLYIFDCFIRRELIRIMNDKIGKSFDMSISINEVYNELHHEIEELFSFMDDELSHRIDQTIKNALDEITNIKEGNKSVVVKCGFRLFDEVGFTSIHDIIGISSARSSGKTRLVIAIVKGFLEHNDNISVQWYSMEDSDTKIIRAFASSDTGISEQLMLGKTGHISEQEFENIKTSINRFNKYDVEIINDQESISNISRKFIRFIKKRELNTSILIIDNLMLIEDIYNAPVSANMTQIEDRVAGNIRKIMNKAKRMNRNVIIIFLHHMTKELENKFNFEEAYRPKLSYMKGTTRFADIASTLYLINKPGLHKDLIKKHSNLADICCIDSAGNEVMVKRETLLRSLMIVELAKNRDGEVTDENVTLSRLITDFGKMKFSELKVKK